MASIATDLLVSLEDRPGTIADLGEALGAAGVNVSGLCAITNEGRGIIHLLTEDAAAARRALEGAGIKVEGETEVIVGDLPPDVDTPGTLGVMARRVANAGINVTLAYLATGNRAVLGTSNNARAEELLRG
ncbi:MAG TPA: amino acid-binding protein [Actinomycetota bacterium]|jgi:hypothetical protein